MASSIAARLEAVAVMNSAGHVIVAAPESSASRRARCACKFTTWAASARSWARTSALPDGLPFGNPDGGHDSTIAMLNRLPLARDDQLAGGIGCRVQWRECGPPQKESEKQDDNDDSEPNLPAYVVVGRPAYLWERVTFDQGKLVVATAHEIFAHGAVFRSLGRDATSRDFAAPPVSRVMISSRDPNASICPSRRTRILSTADSRPTR